MSTPTPKPTSQDRERARECIASLPSGSFPSGIRRIQAESLVAQALADDRARNVAEATRLRGEVERLRGALAEALETEMDGEPLDPEWCERQRALLTPTGDTTDGSME